MSFTTVNKVDWIQKIEKDLKGRPLDDLIWHLSPEVSMDPLVHMDDEHQVICLEKREAPINQLPIAEVSESEENAANKAALERLSQGAGAIIFRNFDLDMKHEALSNGIASDMVAQYSSPYPVSINLSNADSFIKQSIKTMTQVLNENSWDKVQLIECIAGSSFYLNLCGLRALQLIKGQIKNDLSSEHSPEIVLWYPHDESSDIASNLLKSMPVFLAGFLANAQHLGVKSCSVDDERRLHFNNIHLLALEGQLPKLDAVSGSFYLDTLTKKLADHIWESLVKEINTHE